MFSCYCLNGNTNVITENSDIPVITQKIPDQENFTLTFIYNNKNLQIQCNKNDQLKESLIKYC